MNKIPIYITITLIIIAVLSSIFLIKSTNIELNDSQKVTILIAIFACLGALISATFVIYSYIQTNNAFLLSLKPSLLIQVKGENISDPLTSSQKHNTIINYKNVSTNEFTDLSIFVNLMISDSRINLDSLFQPNMFMASQDQRYRIFNTHDSVKESGIDFDNEVRMEKEIILSVYYTFTFNSKTEKRMAPEYKWNSKFINWQLL